MPRASLDAPEDPPTERRSQLALGQLQDEHWHREHFILGPPGEPNRERWAKWAEGSAGVSGGQGSRKPGIAQNAMEELGRDGNLRKMRPRTETPVLLRPAITWSGRPSVD